MSKLTRNIRSAGRKTARAVAAPFTYLVRKNKEQRQALAYKEAGGKRVQGKKPSFMRFPMQDQILFAKRLGMILRSGMPIMQGLEMLAGERHSRSVTFIVGDLCDHVSQGQSLSSGLRKYENVFGPFCVNIVRVGETSGTLHENLSHLAEELKKKQALRKKVIGALVYPAVIVLATVGISLVLTVYIFPKITPIFQSFKATLPLSTRALISMSNFLIKDGLYVFIGFIVALIGIFFLMKVERVRLALDTFVLKIPVVGKLSLYFNLANTTRTLGMLLKSDVRIVDAFTIVTESTHNRAYRKELARITSEVSKGQRVSQHFSYNKKLFPPMLSQMVLVGEQTGNLPGSLLYLSEMYDEEINDLTRNLTTMLEPVLMIVMGVIVGFIAISIITPIYGITQQLKPY